MAYDTRKKKSDTKQRSRSGALALLRKFAKGSHGNIAMMFGLTVVPFFGVVGLGMDGSRALMARYELQAALDAGTLAIGATQNGDVDMAVRLADYVEKNFNVDGAETPQVDPPDTASQQNIINTTARVDLNTYFMGIMGYDKLTIEVSSQVARENTGLMVSLVLDNTGSMWGGNKIGDLRTASQTLLDILFDKENNPTPGVSDVLRISVVPYAASVNVGDEWPNVVEADDDGMVPDARESRNSNKDTNVLIEDEYHSAHLLPMFRSFDYDYNDKSKWRGCVLERRGDVDLEDSPAGGALGYWRKYQYPNNVEHGGLAGKKKDNMWVIGVPATIKEGGTNTNDLHGPNVGCPQKIQPLTGDYDKLTDTVSNLKAWNRGGTLTDIGIAWGFRVMSPGAPFTESTEMDISGTTNIYDSEMWQKAMIIMTDGDSQLYNNRSFEHHSDYTGFGRLNSDYFRSFFDYPDGTNWKRSTGVAAVNTRIGVLCQRAKDDGIIVYTITFGGGAGGSTKAIFEQCASGPSRYFHAPSGEDLKNVFTAISGELSSLRISK